jgi:tellurite methyltransferase
MTDLREQFGDIDIYLFDQLLRGRITRRMRIIDAGCGGGRNLVYLLREGFDVAGCDRDYSAVEAVRALVSRLAPQLPGGNFRVEPVEAMSFADACADVVLASAVLHFAQDDAHFDAMVNQLWRVLKPGGLLFARLASTIGLEARVVQIRGRVHRLPDGSERYLVDEPLLLRITAERGGELLDPLKTTVVQDQRAMTTWVVRKTGDHGGNGGHNEGTEVTEANEEDARPPVHPPS